MDEVINLMDADKQLNKGESTFIGRQGQIIVILFK